MSVRFIESYVHNNRIGVLVELEAVDDFATRTDEFRELARDIAMQIASLDPESTDDQDLEAVAAFLKRDRLSQETERSLMSQPFIKNPAISVGDRIKDVDSRLRARIEIIRYVRFDASAT